MSSSGRPCGWVTWNVWGRYGDDWEEREAGIDDALAETDPDFVCIVESWRQTETTQPELIAERLGVAHHDLVGDREQDGWISDIDVVSRWPMSDMVRRPLRRG